MPEAHLRADVQQLGPRCGLEGRAGTPELRRRPPHQRRVAHGSAAATRSSTRSRPAAPRAAAGSSPRSGPTAAALGQPEPAGELRRREPSGQLQQREGIAARLGDDPVSDALVEPARDDGREQGASVSSPRPSQRQLRQAGSSRVRVGSRTANTIATDSASSRRATKPRTWREAASSHWRRRRGRAAAALGDLGEQAQRAERDQETVGRLAGLDAEGDPKREPAAARAVRRGGRASARRADAARRRKLHLGFDAAICAIRNPDACRSQ
jgi:hypothetical protein